MKFLSPAKLNLNLRVISKRNDGYHNLETTFQLINLFDEISFEESNKSFGFSCDGFDIEPENNLIFKSLNAIKRYCNVDKGIKIHLKKIIPAGAGLGGGSSNAATTLIALNKIWDLNLSTEELVSIGKGLGADVPIFIYGKNAVATGIGDIFLDIELRKNKYLLICPDIEVSTTEMFKKLRIHEVDPKLQNSFLDTLLKEYKSIEEFYKSFVNDYDLKLSGTGSTFFIEYDNKDELGKIFQKIPKNWRFFFCEGLQYSPLKGVLSDGV